jgi:branched-chain amino acid aminotransferase
LTDQESYTSAGVGFMDGKFMDFGDLRLPVSDMGFQLSDMCYDAVHVKDGRFFRLGDHMDRWQRSLAERRYVTLGYDRDAVTDVLHGCVARAGLKDSMVTVIATRGTPESGHKDLRTCKNRLIVWALPYHGVVTDDELESGCDIVVAGTVRVSPDSIDPTIKNFSRLDFVSALFEAYDRDSRYAVLLDGDGYLTEGRGWNIFALLGGELLTPEGGVLEGITRRTVLELSERLNVKGRLAPISADAFRAADEVFLTSTAGGVMPVGSIDGRAIGDGRPGPVTTRIKDMYWRLHDDPAYTTPVKYELPSP